MDINFTHFSPLSADGSHPWSDWDVGHSVYMHLSFLPQLELPWITTSFLFSLVAPMFFSFPKLFLSTETLWAFYPTSPLCFSYASHCVRCWLTRHRPALMSSPANGDVQLHAHTCTHQIYTPSDHIISLQNSDMFENERGCKKYLMEVNWFITSTNQYDISCKIRCMVTLIIT